MFITLTKTDLSGQTKTPITVNVESIVTMTDAYIIGGGSGTNIFPSFTGSDTDGIRVAEPRHAIMQEIARLSEVRRG